MPDKFEIKPEDLRKARQNEQEKTEAQVVTGDIVEAEETTELKQD